MQNMALEVAIARIYESASGQTKWHDTLEAIRLALDVQAVQLVGIQAISGKLAFHHSSLGMQPSAWTEYSRTYHHIDPHLARVAASPEGELISFSHVFAPSFVDRNSFYQDFLIPHGSRYVHSARLPSDEGVTRLIFIHRGPGQAPLEGLEWMAARRICFHLTRASKGLKTEAISSDLSVARDLLDRIRMPTYLIDVYRRVLMRNAVSTTPPYRATPVRVDARGKLECTHPEAELHIAKALQQLSSDAKSEHHQTQPSRTFARIRCQGDHHDHLLCVESVLLAKTFSTAPHHPILMITHHQIGRVMQPDELLLADVFNLTPAEASVAARIACGQSQKQIAHDKGVSLHTVQAQMKSIHGKLGIRKGTELIAKLNAL